MKRILLALLALPSLSGCFVYRYVIYDKRDWDLSAQVHSIVLEHKYRSSSDNSRIGLVPKNLVVRDRDDAKAVPIHYFEDPLWFDHADEQRVCFHSHLVTEPDYDSEQGVRALRTWTYAVEARRSLKEFESDAPWPAPARSGLDSFEVSRSEVVTRVRKGIREKVRITEVMCCGPKPAISPEDNYLLLYVTGEDEMTRHVLVWNLSDADSVNPDL